MHSDSSNEGRGSALDRYKLATRVPSGFLPQLLIIYGKDCQTILMRAFTIKITIIK